MKHEITVRPDEVGAAGRYRVDCACDWWSGDYLDPVAAAGVGVAHLEQHSPKRSATKIAEDYLRSSPNAANDMADLARAYLKLVTENTTLRTEFGLRTKR